MGIQVSAYLVDWNELVKNWQRAKRPPLWFFEAVENNEPWIVEYRPLAWIDSWNAAVDAGLFYDDAREDLSAASRGAFDKFLRTFLASSEKHKLRIRELAG